MYIEHNDVHLSLGFVQLLKTQICQEETSQKEESINTWKTIRDCLKPVVLSYLRNGSYFKLLLLKVYCSSYLRKHQCKVIDIVTAKKCLGGVRHNHPDHGKYSQPVETTQLISTNFFLIAQNLS